MVFSSINGFLDPPNWHQQHDHQQQGGSVAGGGSLQLPPPPPATAAGGSIRPGSMAERARLAKIPQPETALKCPRCESTNTKFCYFNNYNLSQPRHFCKTCRRYWTKGGALRNVPVGGGCRRNKRSKASNRSKSPAKVAGTNSTSPLVSNTCPNNIGHIPSTIPHLPILPPLHHLTDFSSTNIGLNFQPPVAGGGLGFQIGSACSSGGLVDQWRLQQQVPFLGNLEAPNGGLYQFESEGYVGQLRSKALESGINQVKMEDNHQNHDNQGLNLSKNFLGISGNDQYWTANNNNNNTNNSNAWADLPGFTSSSSSHLL